MLLLMAAMTAGALMLLALQGKPIKPMAFSLSSQIQLTAAPNLLDAQLSTPTIDPDLWRRIEICYRTSNAPEALAPVAAQQGLAAALALEYHFVIDSGHAGGLDGQIYVSSAWTEQRPCLYRSDRLDLPTPQDTIRICLIRGAQQTAATSAQGQQLEALMSSLTSNCRTEPTIIWQEPKN